MVKITWRIKTEEEFKADQMWNPETNTPRGWNSKGSMNYLLGTNIPDNMSELCEQRNLIWIDGWRITSSDYTKHPLNILPQVTSNPVIVGEDNAPRFDIERLSKEINIIFQNEFEKSKIKHSDLISESESTLSDLTKKYKDEVSQIFPNIKDELIKEIQRGRTIISFPENIEISIQDYDHPKMKDVVVSLRMQRKALLVGPAGTGKTYMIAEIAKRLDLPFYKYSCSRDSSVHDLIGYKQPTSEMYLETVFLRAYENGGIFLVDKLFVQIY